MFVYNVKVNGAKVFKTFFVIICILVLGLFGMAVYKVFTNDKDINIRDDMSQDINVIESKNYTNILKSVHDNLGEYIGKKVSFTGYVYKVYDLKENEFVLARNMIISSDFQSLVVGFLCDYKKANELENGAWVEITGEIQKGNYHGEVPVLKIKDLKKIEKPSDEYVYPPDDGYVPTVSIL